MDAVEEALRAERDERTARRRTRIRRALLAGGIFAAAVAAMAVFMTSSSAGDDPAPWSVWATADPRASIVVGRSGKSAPVYGSVSDAPGGSRLPREWSPGATVTGQGPAKPTLTWSEPASAFRVLRRFGRHRSASYQSTDVERAGPDGRNWLAFVRGMTASDVTGGAPDPRCVGVWEIHDESDASTCVELRPDGSVRAPDASPIGRGAAAGIAPRWAVRDGAIAIVGGSGTGIDVGLLADDARSFVGRRDAWQPIRGKIVR